MTDAAIDSMVRLANQERLAGEQAHGYSRPPISGGSRCRTYACLPSLFALCAALLSGSQAAADDPFYKGKRLSLIINFAAGGPTDIEGRLLAKHLAKHIDGHPGVLVQNMDGAGGMIGAGYLGEVAPKDGTTLGYFTGSAWRYANNPERFRVDFRTYEFVAYQPGTSIAYMRTDVPPGIKDATDIVKAKGVVAGGLGAENSKDLLLRLGLDMLGVPYKYVTSYRGSSAARLALQQNEINLLRGVAAELPRGGRADAGEEKARPSASGTTPIRAPRSGMHPAGRGSPHPLVPRAVPEDQRRNAVRPTLGRLSHRADRQRSDAAANRASARRAGSGGRGLARGGAPAQRRQGACRGSGPDDRLRAGMGGRPRHQHEVRAAITISPDMRAFIADYIGGG